MMREDKSPVGVPLALNDSIEIPWRNFQEDVSRRRGKRLSGSWDGVQGFLLTSLAAAPVADCFCVEVSEDKIGIRNKVSHDVRAMATIFLQALRAAR